MVLGSPFRPFRGNAMRIVPNLMRGNVPYPEEAVALDDELS